ncbi:probable inactive ATP-dependent zinc metalloprotease FTSHI 2, chloroplastic [Salvia splendens]|uniref:probable inactive ATP-dependent zinc metalloprotease FTSHI 2, chloroplastic n=1 Tax=Salvia splendens TaxID=180675 RepID=UPI001C274DE7|nr:probable inactive ATP-dependent zinc metalloprotease FTSHI 2, chloroplastic [Salvia splendens]
MATNYNFNSCFYRPISIASRPKRPKPRSLIPILCSSGASTENAEEESKKSKRAPMELVKYAVTMTVISAAIPQSVSAAPKVSEKKRLGKKTESLTPEELLKWTKGLPVVSQRLPYSEVLDLKRENKVKHIIKPPSAALRQRPEVILVVMEDNKVVRVVLPSIESDSKFWKEWDELKIDGICMNAYSPSLKKPDIPEPYLGFLSKIPVWLFSLVKQKPQSKKALELKNLREDLKRRRNEELVKMREDREMMEKAMKTQKKMEEREKRREMKKVKYEASLRQAQESSEYMANVWDKLASDPNVSTALGFVFFYIFYRVVVLNYKKQKKDYDDRLKIERAEADEKKKIRELEREMAGMEADDDDEEGGAKGEDNPYSQMAKQFMKSGARVRRAKNRRLPQYLERGVDVKFTDVAGLGKIRLELEEIVKFFTHGDMYRRRGVKIPGGILLCGPPGVGKTLLAKAVAGEAGVNFFSISASQFVEIYVGVGASRVRALYQEARDNAPSVVFIDELDAVGRARGLIKGSGGQERDATLNQLLVCLDGFEGRGEVITIASTNRPDILDAALVRPGRFDRKIHIPKPGLIGRVEILKVHARKKPMAPDVDYLAVATMTDGMVGAELANIIEVAAINMMRDERTEITTDDLLQAAQIEERGMLDKRERSPEIWRQVAINEAAMAIVAVNFPDLKNIEFVTISPRAGRDLGYVRLKMDHIIFKEGMLSRQSLLDHITVQLAPRAADELWYGENQLSTIWAETADNARSAARTLVLGGLSEKYFGLNSFWTEDRIDEIDSEALRILDVCYERAKTILGRNRELLDAVVDRLVEKKSLTKQEFSDLVELHGSVQTMPPTILDIRAASQLQLQNILSDTEEAAARSSIVST